jgi:polyhydroxyalkanoate synthesis regulator phasin
VDQEIEHRLRILVKRGELNEEEATQIQSQLAKAATEEAGEMPLPSEEEIEQLLTKHNVPSRSELQELSSQLEALVAKLDTLAADD